jgi:tetratricopeptide (TPR) repeat protein
MRRLLALTLLAAACTKTPPPAAPKPPAQPAASIDTEEGRARLLALMNPSGTLPVDTTITDLQAMVTRSPDKQEAWLALGQAWIVKARDLAKPLYYANAGACAAIVLAQQPDNRLALELQGLVLMNDHRFEEARAKMDFVTKRWPDDPIGWGTLSDALFDLGRLEESIAAAQKMVDLKPNLPSYSRAAYLQWIRGDDAAAKETLKLAIDAGGDGKDHEPKAWVLVQAAMIFWNEGDAPGAEAGFDASLKTLADFPPALVGKARVLISRGEGKNAVPLLEKAYAASPLVDTGWLLADAREQAGDEGGKLAAWTELDRMGPTADPRTYALFLATKDRSHEQALKLIEMERKVRGDLYTDDAYAWVLYRLGRFDDALAASAHAMAPGTRDARLWFHAGAIQVAKGDTAKGRALLEKALALNPRFDRTGAAEAAKLLAVPSAAK